MTASLCWAVATGCSSAPRPVELDALQKLRRSNQGKQAAKAAPKLAKSSDRARQRAIAAWDDGALASSRHWAILGTIRLRAAIAAAKQQERRARIAALHSELEKQKGRAAQLAQQLADVGEKITLYEQLAEARTNTKVNELEHGDAQKLAAAQNQLSMARMALNLALSVKADQYAAKELGEAKEMIAKAAEALSAEKLVEAAAAAKVAHARAREAYKVARPRYIKARKAVSATLRSALLRAADAIRGVKSRVTKKQGGERLILPVTRLFHGDAAEVRKSRVSTLRAIARVLQKYPNYPVLVVGHTSTKVKQEQRYPVSRARAGAIADRLVGMGVARKRLAVSGRGSEEPLGRAKHPRNDRVDIVILLQ